MIKAYFDGACAPFNPGGHMGIGAYVLDHDGTKIFQFSGYELSGPTTSNNVAEYMALEKCMDFIIDNGFQEEEVTFFSDSKLVTMQMNGKWRVHGGLYLETAERCLNKLYFIKNAKFNWIPRESNDLADKLSNVELFKRGVKFDKPRFFKRY
jgi:ribonuclease HI